MIKYIEYQINLTTDFINKTEFLNIISKVGTPIINSIKNDIYRLFFSPEENKKILFNQDFEIFVKDKVICVVDFLKTNLIKLGFIIKENDYEKIIDGFKKLIEKYLQTKNINYQTIEQKSSFVLFSPIEEKILSEYDTEPIYSLTDSRYELIKKINNLGSKIYKKDMYNLVNSNDKDIEDLIKLHFLHREYVFICKETGRQIIQLENLEVLENNPDSLKCFYCGAKLKDEIREETISLSNISNQIIKDNMWLAAIVYKTLINEKIQEVMVDSTEIGKAIICNNLSEPIVIFILNENFKIHNISLLDIYLSNYKSNYIILITISPSARIIKDYLSQKGLKVILISSYENLANNVKNSINQLSKIFVKDKLKEYNHYFSFKISDLIDTDNKIFEKTEKVEAS